MKVWWNKKTNKLYGWRASKYCILVDNEIEPGRTELIKAGLLKTRE